VYPVFIVIITVGLILYFVYILRGSDPLPDRMPDALWRLSVERVESVLDGATFTARVGGLSLFGRDVITVHLSDVTAPDMADEKLASRKRAEASRDALAALLSGDDCIQLFNIRKRAESGAFDAVVFRGRKNVIKILIEKKTVKGYNLGSDTSEKKRGKKNRT